MPSRRRRPIGARRPTRIWVIGDSGRVRGVGAGLHGCRGRAQRLPRVRREPARRPVADARRQRLQHAAPTPSSRRASSTSIRRVHAQHAGLAGTRQPRVRRLATRRRRRAPTTTRSRCPNAGEAGGVPSGTEAYYSFDWGNIHFISLDSHDSDRSAPANPRRTSARPDREAPCTSGCAPTWPRPTRTSSSRSGTTRRTRRARTTRTTRSTRRPHAGDARALPAGARRLRRGPRAQRATATATSARCCSTGTTACRARYDPPLHAVDAGDGDPDGDGAYVKSALGPSPDSGGVYSVVGSSSQISGGALDHPVMQREPEHPRLAGDRRRRATSSTPASWASRATFSTTSRS